MSDPKVLVLVGTEPVTGQYYRRLDIYFTPPYRRTADYLKSGNLSGP